MAIALNFSDAFMQIYPPSVVAAKLHASESPLLKLAGYKLGVSTQLLDYKARLDNRPVLAAALGIKACDANGWPTADLLLRAYQHWGGDMTKHLRGDWWFAIWDGNLRRLVAAVDPTGPTPLFYSCNNGRAAFSPSLADLLRVPGVNSGLCEKRMLSHLLGWMAYTDYDETEYEGVRQLQPASCLCIDSLGARVHTYWQAGDFQVIHKSLSVQDYIDQFLHLYRKAVSVRIAGRPDVATMLSAGLDSGSVTALAAKEMASRGQGLPAFTHVPIPQVRDMLLDKNIVDEWSLAHTTAMRYPNVEHIAVQSAAFSPLAAYQRGLKMTARLQSTVLNMPWIHQLNQQVQQRHLDTLLCGQLGNLVVTWDGMPVTFWSQLQQRQWGSARTILLGDRSLSVSSLAEGVARHGLRALRPKKEVINKTFAELSAHPARAQLAKQYRNEFEAQVAMRQFGEGRNLRATFLPVSIAASGFNSLIASGYGLDIVDPTADQDLIEFCLSAPNHLFARDGHARWLIRRAMQNILPPEVQWNIVRGFQPADSIYRFLANRDEVETMLEIMQRSNLAQHYLNLPAIRDCWQRLQPSLMQTDDFSLFQSGIGAGIFFAHVEGATLPFNGSTM
jgi:asparagine synthase (glutamine-hydrolysing)